MSGVGLGRSFPDPKRGGLGRLGFRASMQWTSQILWSTPLREFCGFRFVSSDSESEQMVEVEVLYLKIQGFIQVPDCLVVFGDPLASRFLTGSFWNGFRSLVTLLKATKCQFQLVLREPSGCMARNLPNRWLARDSKTRTVTSPLQALLWTTPRGTPPTSIASSGYWYLKT